MTDSYLFGELDAVVDYLNRRVIVGTEHSVVADKDVPREVFHYTSAEATHSILTGGHLRLSNALHMNDPQELTYIVDIFREVAADYSSNYPEMLSILGQVKTEIRADLASDVYIFSCCGEDDLLSQWRAYAGSPDVGYSLAIRTSAFRSLEREVRPSSGWQVNLGRVIYDRAEQKRLLADVVREWTAAYNGAGEGRPVVDPEVIADLKTRARRIFESVAPIFKAEGFREEVEWRLVLRWKGPSPVAQTRVGPRGVVPFVSVQVSDWKAVLAGLRQGPCVESSSAEAGMRRLLTAQRGTADIPLSLTSIQYR